jgi:hypothetical protein
MYIIDENGKPQSGLLYLFREKATLFLDFKVLLLLRLSTLNQNKRKPCGPRLLHECGEARTLNQQLKSPLVGYGLFYYNF